MAKTYEELMQGEDTLQKIGAAVSAFEGIHRKWLADDWRLLSLTVKTPEEFGDEYLLIARFDNGGDRQVTFRSANDLGSLLVGFINAMRTRKLKLREDKYAQGNGS